MDVFNLTWDEVMYKRSWVNLQLLMTDKYRYVGKSKDKPAKELTREEELDFFSKLK